MSSRTALFRSARRLGLIALSAAALVAATADDSRPAPRAGNVIFIHPDGAALQGWNAARILHVGPDANLEWDRLPHISLYRAHFTDGLRPSSHAGATVHAYGVKVAIDSFGMDGRTPIRARSGSELSLMREAQAAGIAVGVVQTGHLAEPGTAVFLARSPTRRDYTGIAAQIIASGAEVILGGGEVFLIPEGRTGHFGQPGRRTDGRDLLAEARAAGYTVVYTRDELAAAARTATKLLGVFAATDTYNDRPEEQLAAAGLPLYDPAAPTVGEMTDAALQLFTRLGRRFFLVVEEEGTDNFANNQNAAGTFEAFRRADEAIGIARRFLRQNPDTLILTAADSDASGLQIVGFGQASSDPKAEPPKVPERTPLGNEVDGIAGAGTAAFTSAPDRAGNRFHFGVVWATPVDTVGGIVVRAAGLNAERLPVSVDNTELYDLMWETLFGRELPPRD
jgi:alkaline phosphatase